MAERDPLVEAAVVYLNEAGGEDQVRILKIAANEGAQGQVKHAAAILRQVVEDKDIKLTPQQRKKLADWADEILQFAHNKLPY